MATIRKSAWPRPRGRRSSSSTNSRPGEPYAWRILDKAYYRLFVSSFPLERRPKKFYEILKFLCPDRIGSIRDYGYKYCDSKPSDWAPTGFTYGGACNTDKLRELVKDVFVRRD